MPDRPDDAVTVLYTKDWRSGRMTRKEYPPTNVVYFVRGARALKIGTTERIVYRFDQLQAESPVKLELVGMIYGGENVERWCQFHCIDHRSHHEWFKWNDWTEAFSRWILAHGDHAARQVCPAQAKLDAVAMGPGQRRASRCDVPQMPQMKFIKDPERMRLYRESAARRIVPWGTCSCSTCAAEPWNSWRGSEMSPSG